MSASLQAYKTLNDIYGELFTPEELQVGGSQIGKLSVGLLDYLYRERSFHNYPTHLSSLYRENDPNAHGRGEAADKIIFHSGGYLQRPLDPMQMWAIATTWPWWGVGLYFDWWFYEKGSGEKVRSSGIHTDVSQTGSRPLRWIGLPADRFKEKSKGKYHYFYQSHLDGVFYNSVLNSSYCLEQAIEQFYE